ncbi:MAG TPA: biotin/lipoyl-containing protein [Ktedonobacteraceae bacterium]|jgi:acetyl-CoA carboxylase biotin carboxyl carrier protein|nr:biotin/lipoyl-containing protein [Ktedonobacteraceae bacterium]
MEGNGQHVNDSALLTEVERKAEHISIAQLQQLVRLLDNTEVSEIEIKRAASGTRLVLRKARLTEGQAHFQGVGQEEEEVEAVAPVETKHTVVAPLVGIFHTWAKPKGKALVSVGDRVKVGQLVGTIQSLNVINEVESALTGRVTELLVQDGQAVEYGQPLLVVDTSEEI